MPNHSLARPGRSLIVLGVVLFLGLSLAGPSSGSGFQETQAQRMGPVATPVMVRIESANVPMAEMGQLRTAINAIWVLIAAFLVMSLKAGFSLVETGLTRAKNVAHTMSMNFAIYAVAILGFWAFGFALMFGGHDAIGGTVGLDSMVSVGLFGQRWDVFGFAGFFLNGPASSSAVLSVFVLQAMFVDTAATIPTGAMAERWKFQSFLAYGLVASALIYPVYGCWVWGNGWLSDLGDRFGWGNGMVDFAGSTVVHMTGGMMALAGAISLGPRIGKFNKNGSVNAIPGHNVPMVVLGTLILAFGWFGLNTGRAADAADLRIGSIATCTILATAAGCLTSMGTMWVSFGKPDPTMSCNGLLAGAVAISASCAYVNPIGAVAIGAVAGALVVGSILFLEKGMGIDDPVGAISVHGVCGAFGTLCVGLFATGEYGQGLNGVISPPIGLLHGGGFGQLIAQMVGVTANLLWTLPMAFLTFAILGRTIGNRVSARAEVEGLDVPEMGVLGYVPEETYAVQTANQDYLATFGPGVPPKGASSATKGTSRKK